MVLKTKITPLITPIQPLPILTNIKITKNCLSFSLKKKQQQQISKHTNTIKQNPNTYLLFGSLNTRGLHNQTKLNCLLQHIIDNKYLIFRLSETKLSQIQISKITLTPYHIIWNPIKNNTKAGTALIIHNTLFPISTKQKNLKVI